jgi:hypothetical protein
MNVAMWVLSSFLVVVITMVAMGMAIRPYIAVLVSERDAWKHRALDAEGMAQRDDRGDVRLIDPKDLGLPWQDDVWLKGQL